MDYTTLHRISTFVPLGRRTDPSGAAVADLIRMALCLADGSPQSPQQVQESILVLTGVRISQLEVETGLGTLAAAKQIQRYHEIANVFAYGVSDDVRHEARRRLLELEEARTRVHEALARSFGENPDGEVRSRAEPLARETDAYLKEIVRINGVWAVAAVHGHEVNPEDLQMDADADAARENVVTRAAIRAAATDLLRSTDDVVRRYVLALVNAGVTYAALHLDSGSSKLLCAPSRLRDTCLLLDTNVIFRLLGLNGDYFQSGVIDVLKASRDLGCRLFVSTETVREYKSTLRAHVQDLQGRRLPSNNDLVDLLTGTLEEFDFRLAFLQERKKRGRFYTTEVFQERYLAVERHVQEQSVRILEGEVEREVRADDEQLLNVHSQYNTWLNSHEKDRTGEAVAHDARVLEFVRRRQRPNSDTLDAAGWVFLTCDRALAGFEAHSMTRDRRRGVPSCVTLEAWMQYVAPLLPRVEDYERGFLNFLSVPFFNPSPMKFEDAAEVLARIETQESLSQGAAMAVLYGTRARAHAERLTRSRREERQSVIDQAYQEEVRFVEEDHRAEVAALNATLERAKRETERVRSDATVREQMGVEAESRLRRELADLVSRQDAMSGRLERIKVEYDEAETRWKERCERERAERRATEEAAKVRSVVLERRARWQARGIISLLAIVTGLVMYLWTQGMAVATGVALCVPIFAVISEKLRSRVAGVRYGVAGTVSGAVAVAVTIPNVVGSLNVLLQDHQGLVSGAQLVAPVVVWVLGSRFLNEKGKSQGNM
jgi:hypothetical protein